MGLELELETVCTYFCKLDVELWNADIYTACVISDINTTNKYLAKASVDLQKQWIQKSTLCWLPLKMDLK